MKVYFIDFAVVRVVVLDQAPVSNVPDFHGAIGGARGHAGAIGVKTHGVDAGIVVNEGVDALAGGEVKELDGVVV